MSLKPGKYTLTHLEIETGMTRRALADLLRDTDPVETKGRYRYYTIKQIFDAVRGKDKRNAQAERAELDYWRAQKVQLEAEQLAGTLVDIEEVGPLWENTYANYRQRLDAVPVKAAPLVKGQPLAKIKEIIEDLIRDAVNDFAGTPPGTIADPPSAARGKKAEKAKGQRVGGRAQKTKPGGKRGAG